MFHEQLEQSGYKILKNFECEIKLKKVGNTVYFLLVPLKSGPLDSLFTYSTLNFITLCAWAFLAPKSDNRINFSGEGRQKICPARFQLLV